MSRSEQIIRGRGRRARAISSNGSSSKRNARRPNGKASITRASGLAASKAASDACVAAGKAAIKVQGYPKVPDELQQIVIGRVDAVWETDTAVADFRLKNPGKYDIAFTVPGDFKYGIYFGKGKTDVGTALTAALKALKDDGTLAALATKYNLDPANLDVIQ